MALALNNLQRVDMPLNQRNQSDPLFTFLGSNISSTESDVSIPIGYRWTAVDRLSLIWKRGFFQAVAVLVQQCAEAKYEINFKTFFSDQSNLKKKKNTINLNFKD